MNEINFPIGIDTTPEDDYLYSGMSKQDLGSHQAICELVDNAISATSEDSNFTIEIHIEKNGEEIRLKIADEGNGISLEDITQKVLKLGGKGSFIGKLNEHGFGLINSLCVLTGNNRDFSIVTRDSLAFENNAFYLIKGPFRNDMKVEEGDESDWSEDIYKCHGEVGTRINLKTSFNYFKTLYPSAYRLDTLVERLMEHLGVIYRYFLSDRRNSIWIRWRDISDGTADWNNESVISIEVPYINNEYNTFEISYNGNTYKAEYIRGDLDDAIVQDGSIGKPYPLRIYYQKNQKTQGIDISVRDRVIQAHEMGFIWPDLDRHNDYNSFIGELKLLDKDFSTVNNKTRLDPNNPIWEKLKNELQQDEYKPGRTRSTVYNEQEMRNKLVEKLPSIVSGSSAEPDFVTWAGLGVKIDILHKLEDGDEHIYELKAGNAKPLDVYQLIMYWDGRVEDGTRPSLGRLVAKDANSHVKNLIQYWNDRKDAGGKQYKIEFVKKDDILG